MPLSILRIPVSNATAVWLRCAPVPRQGAFEPNSWRHDPLTDTHDGWLQIDLSTLALADGTYEYEFVVDRQGGSATVADPYAEEITRFSGYRGLFHIQDGQRIRLPFLWSNEIASAGLPQNNQIVIYELPMRWIDPGEDGLNRQVGLGTFDKAIFELLDDRLVPLGVNCVELLPVQDSPDTLNWGYGTRFFFAPDYDMGEAFDLKLFVLRCHQRGIRVIMDVVMNHAKKCPLRDLAFDSYFLRDGNEEPAPDGPRSGWGGDIFRYRSVGAAKSFHLGVAEFLINEYHIDGFRLDEFKGIDNYEFVQDFTEWAHAVHGASFPNWPFVVIAEDSWRRSAITTSGGYRNRRVVDSMWDFDFRDDVRRLASNTLSTVFGQLSRTERVKRLLTIGAFPDMACRVTYCTSHDVEADDEQRLFSYFSQKLGATSSDSSLLALDQVHAAFALTLTAAGVPMFLAGEEFADLHDTDHRDWRRKMSDPVDWERADEPGRRDLLSRIRDLIWLRRQHAALQRNEVQFFGYVNGFHPDFDKNDAERLFAYCRTGGQPLGSSGQVIVVANCRRQDYPEIWVDWPWGFRPTLRERGGRGQAMPWIVGSQAKLPLTEFQVRVFEV
jgi:1,4-alpha-glucan branching enzyme